MDYVAVHVTFLYKMCSLVVSTRICVRRSSPSIDDGAHQLRAYFVDMSGLYAVCYRNADTRIMMELEVLRT